MQFYNFTSLVHGMLTLDFDNSDDYSIPVTVVSSAAPAIKPSTSLLESDSTTNLVKWIIHEEVKALNFNK